MVVIAVGTTLLEAPGAEIFVTLTAVMSELLLVSGAKRERVDFVYAFELVAIHHPATMVIFRALFA